MNLVVTQSKMITIWEIRKVCSVPCQNKCAVILANQKQSYNHTYLAKHFPALAPVTCLFLLVAMHRP